MDAIYWDHYYNNIILLNLLIVVGLFTILRFFSGAISHTNASKELLKKDNPAFGVSLAGATFAITIMLSGTIYGSPENDTYYSILSVGVFGLIGIALLAITRVIFDKITLPDISLRDEIVRGNLAVGIVDAANVLAAAIIIRTIMIWVTVFSKEGIIALFGGYIISQLLLTLMTLVKSKIFSSTNKGLDVQSELRANNTALAIRFAGKKIGMAFAIAMAARLVVYEVYEVHTILIGWLIASLIAIAIWKVLCIVADKAIFWGVDTNDEVANQKNVAVGALQAVIYISMGVLLSSL